MPALGVLAGRSIRMSVLLARIRSTTRSKESRGKRGGGLGLQLLMHAQAGVLGMTRRVDMQLGMVEGDFLDTQKTCKSAEGWSRPCTLPTSRLRSAVPPCPRHEMG